MGFKSLRGGVVLPYKGLMEMCDKSRFVFRVFALNRVSILSILS